MGLYISWVRVCPADGARNSRSFSGGTGALAAGVDRECVCRTSGQCPGDVLENAYDDSLYLFAAKEKQMSLEEIEAEIKKLSLGDRATLAKRLVESLDELSEAEIEALWVKEAEHRLDELEQGSVAEVQAEEAMRRARAAIS